MRRVVMVLILLSAGCSKTSDLTYTMSVEPRVSAGADAKAAEAAAMIAAMQTSKVETTVMAGAKGTRAETTRAGVPGGEVRIQRPDGSMVHLNLQDKTYWTIPKSDSQALEDAMKRMEPKVTTRRTGEFETIAGFKAERVSHDVTMKLMPYGGAPASESTTTKSTIDMWMTDDFKFPSNGTSDGLSNTVQMLGIDQKTLSGFPLRMVIKMEGADFEVVFQTTKVSREPIDPAMFDVPAGYREVPSPGPGRPISPMPGRGGGGH